MIFFVKILNISIITLILKIDRKTNSKIIKLFDKIIDETFNVNINIEENRTIIN